ncbi:unnamed protein product [Vitrella brassicaformis CCMP3155]|uniref:Photolyase/cryptochrome alpha/beta domain-containing protein n=1 Tax=Vitrella brassicaformis (strain CCMP3155) TaxID=1169540 RepID=A0A0G4EYQ6_VITBC|nr:unnamed protein product [Vitrella brassicaformis CCMP3155]|eukprot:CEM04076.1 unnamed protein product [Vitrella brassicaformis CCMP3155]
MGKSAVLWFRKGLRLHDNLALLEACKDATHVYPVFIIDPHFVGPGKVGVNRYRFLLECLTDLDTSLKTKYNSRLIVLRGNPLDVMRSLLKDKQPFAVDKLCYEFDSEPYARSRDAEVTKIAKEGGVEVTVSPGHTLFDLDEILKKFKGTPPLSYGPFVKMVESIGPPQTDKDAPAAIPAPPAAVLGKVDESYSVPTLQEMGCEETPHNGVLRGGETVGLQRLHDVTRNEKWIATFEKPKTKPTDFNPASTTQMSPYMKFGCVSARKFYHHLLAIYKRHKGHSQPPVSLLGQLYWREFFYTVGYATNNYDRMAGNKICRQIAWVNNEEWIEAWQQGKTGYPWIDAAMRQLRREGWMHHLARHAVACFLTRGDLFCSWEVGAKTFDELLIDADWSINNGNWMWLSCSCFFYQFFRIYHPSTFAKKYDPTGAYVRRYVPELRHMPDKYVYEPWKAPKAVQEEAKCIIGQDYPEPIVDHAEASQECKDRMKAAYDEHKAIKRAPKSEMKPDPDDEEEDDEEGEEEDDDEDYSIYKPLDGTNKRSRKGKKASPKKKTKA